MCQQKISQNFILTIKSSLHAKFLMTNPTSFSPLRAKRLTKRERGREEEKEKEKEKVRLASKIIAIFFFCNYHITAKLYIIQYCCYIVYINVYIHLFFLDP